MTQIIVPLAGPDIYQPDIKPLREINGETMIQQVLGQRSWIKGFQEGRDQLTFILRADEGFEKLSKTLEAAFPAGSVLQIPNLTQGASFSALAGLSQSHDIQQPIIVDLVDIQFSLELDATQYFQEQPTVAAIVPYFPVDQDTPLKEKYSYLELEGDKVLRAREKEVISDSASAGVYLFRDAGHYLQAMNFSIRHPEIVTVGGVYFVCPMVNALIGNGKEVRGIQVHNAESYST